SQTMVMWKNRQMAANRRRFDPGALIPESAFTEEPAVELAETKSDSRSNQNTQTRTNRYGNRRRVQGETPNIVKKGGFSLAPALLTTNSSATARLAARKKGSDPELVVPDDPAERAKYETAFARFAAVFPD